MMSPFSFSQQQLSSLSLPLIAFLSIFCVVGLQIFLGKSNNNENNNSQKDTPAPLLCFSIEFRRRLQHALTGQVFVWISYLLSKQYCALSLVFGILLILYIRLLHDELYRRLFGKLLRKEELMYGVLPGAFWFLCGTLVSLLVYDMDIARYSVLSLSYADPAAAFVGSSIPSVKLFSSSSTSSASLSGSMACFLTACLVGWFYFQEEQRVTPVIVVGALATTIAEIMPNDNLFIPIIAGAAITWCQSMG